VVVSVIVVVVVVFTRPTFFPHSSNKGVCRVVVLNPETKSEAKNSYKNPLQKTKNGKSRKWMTKDLPMKKKTAIHMKK
jgi:hypothetical protein